MSTTRIVVMGGSFNPPTIAHLRLMQAALDALPADKGVFVPASHAYLKRKLRRTKDNICLPESMRLAMLCAMCADDARMCATDMEFGKAMARTYNTLLHLQQQYPEGQLYFLMGADKLNAAWVARRCFLEKFHVVIFGREGVDPMTQILATPGLAAHADRFSVVPQPEDVAEISSTAVRHALIHGGSIDQQLHPAVAELLKTMDMDWFQDEIDSFKGEYAFLNNDYPAKIIWEGIPYPCVEAAFQASKISDTAKRKEIATCSMKKLKQKVSSLQPQEGWEEAKFAIMKELLLLKFRTHPELAEALLATGKKHLINGHNSKDTCWSINLYSWKGENHLGRLLMEVRYELQQAMGH